MKYLPLLIVASLLNWQQKQALFLTLIVGLGLVIPVPKEYGALAWYSICAGIDFTIFIIALNSRAMFSIPIAALSALFITIHYIGWTFDGYPPDSPYHYFARTIGFTELFTCAILSNPIINYVKGKIK